MDRANSPKASRPGGGAEPGSAAPAGDLRIGLGSPAGLLALWFGVGLAPKAPGSWASAAALPLAWLLFVTAGPWAVLAGAAAVFFLGVWASAVTAARMGEADPASVVIDEVAGQLLVLAVVPADPLLYGAGFVLFRIADIFKPWPVSWADRRVKGGLGIMLDDVLAAVYAGAALMGFHLWIGG